MTVKGDGKVGIGTTAPGSNIEVRGATETIPNLGTYGTFFNLRRTDGHIGLSIGIDSSTNHFWFQAQNSTSPIAQALILNPKGGNVGIGTTAPAVELDVAGVIQGQKFQFNDDTNTSIDTFAADQIGFKLGANNSVKWAFVAGAYGMQFMYGSGTASYPSYTWNGDSDTGIFNATTNALGFTTAGTERVRIAADGKVGIGMGTSWATAMLDVRRGDTSGKVAEFHQSAGYGIDIGSSQADAYISSGYVQDFLLKTDPGSGQVERMRIKADGKVGIGTTNPGRKLTVEGGSGDNLPVRIIGGASTTKSSLEFQDPTTTADYKVTLGSVGDNMFFQAGGSERIRILADGKVGIGTNAPDQKLSVTGNIQARSGYWFIARSGDNAGYSYLKNPSTSGSEIAFHTSGEKMRLLSNGNFGIGTSAPQQALHVESAANQIRIQDSTNNKKFDLNVDGDKFMIDDMSVGANRFAIASNGNVGIGTTAPLAKLHVREASAGSFTYDGTADTLIVESNANGGITIATAAANTGRIIFASPNDPTGAEIKYSDATSLMTIGTTTPNDHLVLQAGNGVEAVRVQSDGNVGIGSASPAAPLDVPRASDYKVTKFGDDVTSHYVLTSTADHTLTLTCTSYFQAEIVITANQTNGGTYNNLYIRGIWSNNHTSHHWDEIENIGSLSGSTFTITVGQNGATTNSGEWKIVHDYVSGSFAGMTVRITDFYGTHAYTIS